MDFIEKRALVEKVLKTIIVRQSEILFVLVFSTVHDDHTVYHIHAY